MDSHSHAHMELLDYFKKIKERKHVQGTWGNLEGGQRVDMILFHCIHYEILKCYL